MTQQTGRPPGRAGPPSRPAGYWPIAGLRVLAGPLELRLPDAADLTALAALAEAGVHDPAVQPFGVPWTDVDPAARARSVLQYHWSCLGSWSPATWTLNLVVVRAGTVLGTQGLGATDFPILREVGTGSWLGRRYQGRGIGTAMRASRRAGAGVRRPRGRVRHVRRVHRQRRVAGRVAQARLPR